ncbi:hypothetical protein TNCV_3727281 [Trichonephila clavipes]|uniref:Uncharacterized protein n=1 Tax=Trichonephila clavipes TaxID=2585209 RepID=A0A8X6UYE9_TRICX|nr:hypothetical protein TNCV_3727281 [Trichonephila clavipes]
MAAKKGKKQLTVVWIRHVVALIESNAIGRSSEVRFLSIGWTEVKKRESGACGKLTDYKDREKNFGNMQFAERVFKLIIVIV